MSETEKLLKEARLWVSLIECGPTENQRQKLKNNLLARIDAHLAKRDVVEVPIGAAKLLVEIFEERGDIDGGWLQDKATELGVLVAVLVTEPCVDPEIGNCACAEYGDFPTECYRINPELLRAAQEGKA